MGWWWWTEGSVGVRERDKWSRKWVWGRRKWEREEGKVVIGKGREYD